MKLTKFFVHREKLTTLLMITILMIGIASIMKSPRQDSPNVNFNILYITSIYPGASASDVEINVTDPIEDQLEGIDGIDETSSYSIEGMSLIYIMIDHGVKDLAPIKNDIQSAIDRINTFPTQMTLRPTLTEMKSTEFPIIEIAIAGPESKGELLRKITKDLESDIMQIGNVGSIDRIAYRKKEMQIKADPEKLRTNQVSFAELISAVSTNNVRLSSGSIESTHDKKKIVTAYELFSENSTKDLIIRSNHTGMNVKVSDIATVSETYQKKEQTLRTNGINSINLIVKRRGTTDTLTLSDNISKIIEQYQSNYQSQGITITKVIDFSYYTRSLLNIVTSNAILGFILVIITLFIFLNFHSAVWVAAGIPISILASFIIFPYFDISINQVSLITIIMVLGMLVDDAIVIAENITSYQEQGMDFKKAAIQGTKEMFLPVMATVTTTMICFIPIFFMTGILGKFIYTIPIIVILTLGLSLLESATLLPTHLGMRKSSSKTAPKVWMENLKHRYGVLLTKTLIPFRTKGRRKATLIFATLIGLMWGLISMNRFELFPTDNFDFFYILMEAPNGTSLDQTLTMVQDVEKEVAKIPKDTMVNFKTVIGDHRTDEATANPALHENWALITVYLHPAAQRSVKSEEVIEQLKERTKNIKHFEKFEIREVQDGPPVGRAITVSFVSDNFELCEKYSSELYKYLSEIPGVDNIESNNKKDRNEIQVILNPEAMARTGISASDIAQTLRVAFDGHIATTTRRDGEEIDFRISLADKFKEDLTSIKKLQIPNRQGQLINIDHLVNFKEVTTYQSINHFKGKRSIRVTADIDSSKTKLSGQEINELIKKKFESRINQEAGINMIFGGIEKETMQAMTDFIIAFIFSIIGIYFILVLLLNSYLQPVLIMVAIPFGVLGALIAFLIHGLPMSFMGMIGTLGMIGVVVNDSLVMVTHLNSIKESKGSITITDVVDGAKTRLRPVILTTLTTLFGLLPTAYGIGGYEPFLVPMVLALSWGLGFATLITLFLIPILFVLTHKELRRESNL